MWSIKKLTLKYSWTFCFLLYLEPVNRYHTVIVTNMFKQEFPKFVSRCVNDGFLAVNS